jgi:sulfate adenylyltransferase
LRKALGEGGEVPAEFSRPEVLTILREYYASIKEEDKVEVKMHGHATGEAKKK